ncbi:MAG: hypothetical protein ACYTEQ_06575 [Planctomycetota bacterium]|jgi:hypothetical protein
MSSLTQIGGPRARKLIKAKFTLGAVSDTWYVWGYDPDDATYKWHEQYNAAFEFAGHIGGTVIVPSGWTTADIGLKVSHEATGTFVPFQIDGTAGYVDVTLTTVIEQAVAANAYAMPHEWFGAGPFAKLHSMTASQAGDQSQTDKEIIMWLVA